MSNRFVLLCCAICSLAIAVVLIAPRFVSPSTTVAESGCPDDWYNSDDIAVRNRCGQQKHIQAEQQAQQEQATAILTPYAQRWPDYVPQVLPKPTDMVGPMEIPPINTAGGPPVFRDADSVWFLDYVSNIDQTLWSELYLVAFGGEDQTPTYLQTAVINSFDATMEDNEHIWTAPANTGPITVTSVTGWPAGTVSFKTASGKQGTFDFGTELWSIEP